MSWFVAVAQADDWPQWRGPNRDGVSTETGWVAEWPDEGPKILWKAEVGKGCSSLAVANGRLYTMGNVDDGGVAKDVVWCLNAETGEVVWKYSYPQPLEPSGYEGGPCVTPCVDGNFIYTVSKRGRAWCFDARTGKLIWDTYPDGVVNAADGAGFNGGMTSSPFVHGDLLITGARALRKDNGKVVWNLNPAEACQWASPALYSWDGRESVLCFNTRGLTCVNLADGSKEWNYPLNSDSCSAGADPVLYGDQILLSTRPLRRGDPATMLLQITEAGPKVAWSRSEVVSNFQERVVWKDHVERWAGAANAVGTTAVAPVLANHRIYCRGATGDLVCLDVNSRR